MGNGYRRQEPSWGVPVLLLCAFLGCQRQPRPNIVLYVVDTMRADALQCYGNAEVQTPAMDGLARDGVRFARAHANASWTRASMGSLLTGEYPSTHGAVGRLDGLRHGLPLLQQQLKRSGYRTAAIVANPNIGSPFGFGEGFDEMQELYEPHGGVVHPEELIASAATVVDRAIAWLHTAPTQPFFLMVFSVDPHAPYTPPPPYNTLYDPDYTGSIDGSFKSLFGLALFGANPPPRDVRHIAALYHGEVTYNDAQFARLLGELQRLDLNGRTLVVLTSDHGEEFYEHGGRDHGHTLYEELIHVPLIMRWSGHIPPGRVYPGVVQLIDVYATLLHIGTGHAASGPGRDLFDPVFDMAADSVPSMAYAEENLDSHQLEGTIVADQKLIVVAGRPEPLTFNLTRDPAELHPLPGPPPDVLTATMATVRAHDLPPPGAAARRIPATELPESAREALKALGYGDPTDKR